MLEILRLLNQLDNDALRVSESALDRVLGVDQFLAKLTEIDEQQLADVVTVEKDIGEFILGIEPENRFQFISTLLVKLANLHRVPEELKDDELKKINSIADRLSHYQHNFCKKKSTAAPISNDAESCINRWIDKIIQNLLDDDLPGLIENGSQFGCFLNREFPGVDGMDSLLNRLKIHQKYLPQKIPPLALANAVSIARCHLHQSISLELFIKEIACGDILRDQRIISLGYLNVGIQSFYVLMGEDRVKDLIKSLGNVDDQDPNVVRASSYLNRYLKKSFTKTPELTTKHNILITAASVVVAGIAVLTAPALMVTTTLIGVLGGGCLGLAIGITWPTIKKIGHFCINKMAAFERSINTNAQFEAKPKQHSTVNNSYKHMLPTLGGPHGHPKSTPAQPEHSSTPTAKNNNKINSLKNECLENSVHLNVRADRFGNSG